jgi:hypothetical protein
MGQIDIVIIQLCHGYAIRRLGKNLRQGVSVPKLTKVEVEFVQQGADYVVTAVK